MWKAVVLTVALAAGCGGSSAGTDPPPRAPSIAGNWIASINPSCDVYLDMAATEFVFGDVCVGADSSVETQATKGTYSYDGTTWVTNNTSSTCSDTPRAYASPLRLSGGNLVMSDSSTAISFARNTASGSGVLTYGCFKAGVFTASPLAPL